MALTIGDNPPEFYSTGGTSSHPIGVIEAIKLHARSPSFFADASGNAIAYPSAGWCAVQTKSRAEKALAWHCLSQCIPYFLPMTRSLCSSPGNKTRSTRNAAYLPLLPGILFMAAPLPTVVAEIARLDRPNPLNPSARNELYRTVFGHYEDILRKSRHVFGFLHTNQQERLAKELVFLASETPDSRTLRMEEVPPAGCPVRVRPANASDPGGSPFQGLEGVVSSNPADVPFLSQENDPQNLQSPPKVRLVVNLHMLGRSVSVEIDADKLEAIG